MLQLTGERQIATDIGQISPDHRSRYQFAAEILECEGGIVLDAACGNGYGSYILASEANVNVVGVDISKDAIECANEHYKVDDLVSFELCDLVDNDLPGENNVRYDAVISFETIEHVADPINILRKFTDLSDKLICSVPNEDVVPHEHNKFPFHFRHYTAEDFTQLLEDSGWRITEWFAQYDKQDGTIYDADDGRTHIVVAEKIV